jgi:hypothetical protein
VPRVAAHLGFASPVRATARWAQPCSEWAAWPAGGKRCCRPKAALVIRIRSSKAQDREGSREFGHSPPFLLILGHLTLLHTVRGCRPYCQERPQAAPIGRRVMHYHPHR